MKPTAKAHENHERLVEIVHRDNPNTSKERWQNCCTTMLLQQLLNDGREITVLVGPRKLVTRGQLTVIPEEGRH